MVFRAWKPSPGACRQPGLGVACLWHCHTDSVSGDFGPTVRLVSGFSYYREHGLRNLINFERKYSLSSKNLTFEKPREVLKNKLGATFLRADHGERPTACNHLVKLCIPAQLLVRSNSVTSALTGRWLFRVDLSQRWILMRGNDGKWLFLILFFILGVGVGICSSARFDRRREVKHNF